jgi:Putative transposase DNA-binding domain
MDVHLTITAKLVTTTDAAKELKSTLEEFNRACNTISELSFQQDLRRIYDIYGCLHIGVRPDQSNFHCRDCGLQLNADLNGAKSIALAVEESWL